MSRTLGTMTSVLAALVIAAGVAQANDGVKIGLIGDMSGPYAALNGEGGVVAANLAIEDVGGSVLGQPVTIVTGDNQNKPDIAAGLARKFYDNDGVDAILDGGNSSTALAIQYISKERKKIFLISGGTTADVTGKACSPYSIHWLPDTHALATASSQAVLAEGGKTWFFVAANYVFGQDLERYATDAIKLRGGQVLGSTRHPFNTSDFSSYLLQAQSSGAQVLALANAGSDTQNAIKQAQEFGMMGGKAKTRVVAMNIFSSDVQAMGLAAAQGVISTADFYWDMNDATRTWSKRFKAKFGKVPTSYQAGTYSAVYHYLSAVKAVGSTDAEKVAAHMYKTVLQDSLYKGSAIRKDGRVMQPVYLMHVKSPSESTGPDDIMKVVATISPEDAFVPLEKDRLRHDREVSADKAAGDAREIEGLRGLE